MRIDGSTVIRVMPNTGTYKFVACEPYLDNSTWKLKVSFYADGTIYNMIFVPDSYI